MEVIKDILKGAGIGGFVTLVVLGLSVRDAAAQPSGPEGRGAAESANSNAQRRFDATSARPRETAQGDASRDFEPSDLAIARVPPRSVRPLPRLSGVPHPMAALDGDVLAATA